jgi:hypothetical protein
MTSKVRTGKSNGRCGVSGHLLRMDRKVDVNGWAQVADGRTLRGSNRALTWLVPVMGGAKDDVTLLCQTNSKGCLTDEAT